jgi:hypothetical protein
MCMLYTKRTTACFYWNKKLWAMHPSYGIKNLKRQKDSTKRTEKLCEVYSAYNPKWIFWESKLWKTTAENDMPRKIIAVCNGNILSKQRLNLLWKDLIIKKRHPLHPPPPHLLIKWKGWGRAAFRLQTCCNYKSNVSWYINLNCVFKSWNVSKK